jgi:hypothetical protein
LKKITDTLGIMTEKDFKNQPIKYQGETKDIVFNNLMLGDGYIWLLENRTNSLNFESTFKFELTNLTVISSFKG